MTAEESMYPGPLIIEKSSGLNDYEQLIEEHFATYIQSNIKEAISRYKQANGKRLDTDEARALSSIWALSNKSRALCSNAVHSPASAIIKELYKDYLDNAPGTFVIFTAGGGGSGKSTATVELIADLEPDARAIYDTTFSNFKSAQRKVDMALNAQVENVIIIYVYRPFEDAVRGAIRRAVKDGRVVPLKVLAEDHIEAPKTVLKIAEYYKDEPRLVITVVDNSGRSVDSSNDIVSMQEALSFLEKLTYNTYEDFCIRAKGVLVNEQRESTIDTYITRAFRGEDT